MAATTTPLTVQQFLALDLPEGQKHELIGGEIVTMPKARWIHELVKAIVFEILVEYNSQARIGRVLCETGYILTEEDGLIPDISFVLNEQIASLDPEEIPAIAPALAVEVVSSETAARLEHKIEVYLERGTRTVLVVYPARRAVVIHSPRETSRPLHGDDLVEIDWMPGFSVPASRFFEGLAPR